MRKWKKSARFVSRLLTMLLLLALSLHSWSQETEGGEDFTSSQLEEITESDDTETDDDYNLQQLASFKDHPLSINSAADELRAFPLFDALLVENILQYRRLLGDFISIYELQAVPGFTIDLLRKIAPFITVSSDGDTWNDLKKSFSGGDRTFIVRPTGLTQQLLGFKTDNNDNRFMGAPWSLLVRYKYQCRKLVQYGITLEKDAGEMLMSKKPAYLGDFQSFYIFLRSVGKFRAIAAGDYTVNLGQGLIHWQSRAFKKSSSVMNIKRQSEILRPYQSTSEFNFFRGAAATWGMKKIELTMFASRRSLTANKDEDESMGVVVTSFNTSGLHRSASEVADKNAVTMFSSGSNIKWRGPRTTIGLNGIYHQFSLPVKKQDEAYNIFSISGKWWANASVDFNHTIRNYHLFGEMAVDKKSSKALLAGVISSLNKMLDAAFLIRRIDRGYQSFYGNAFTENTMPGNEMGVYAGSSIRATPSFRIDVYTDVFQLPWLKFRVDAPASGMDYLVQGTWKPSKKTEVYIRWRNRMKPMNVSGDLDIDYPETSTTKNFRAHVSYQYSKSLALRSRVELCSYSTTPASAKQYGYLFYTDVIVKPQNKWYAFNARIQYFDSESYDTRVYAYENDLLMVSSTPSFFNRGIRIYVNVKARRTMNIFGKKSITLSLKFANTTFSNINAIGSGTNAINGNKKTDIRFQVFFNKR